MKIGEKIRQQRRFMNIRQEELSKRVGVSLKTIQRWENGERSPRMGEIESLSKALEKPLSYFIDIDDTDKKVMPETLLSAPDDGRDIMTDNKAGHLIFRHGNTIVDLPDTPENKGLYWRVVEKMLSFPAVEME